jgi:predicted ABC-type ATPase
VKPASEPVFIIVAGPNGAGKSTLARAQGIPVVDPDVETARAESNMAGGRATVDRIRQMIGRRESFALETTLSGHHVFRVIQAARTVGFHVLVFFVGIASAEDCLERIKRRVELGGHDVPVVDVLRRYPRSLDNLPKAIALADRTLLFDNTDPGEPRFVASFESGVLSEQGDVTPLWFIGLQRSPGN